MHIFQFAFYCTAIVYAIFYNQIMMLWFLSFILLYVLISIVYPKSQNLSTRRKLALSNWPPPSQGIIYNNISVRVDKLLSYLDAMPPQNKLTITHFVIKSCGEVLKQNPQLNGKLIFGKFVPYQTCDVSCLINIDNGNDVGLSLIKDIPNKSIYQIGQQIRNAGKIIRPKGGDIQHKKRTGILGFLPVFLVGMVFKFSIFITSHFGVNIPFLGLKKNALGAMIVTSVGNFGYIDAYTSFFGTTGQWILLTVNAIHQQAIVVDGKIQIGKMVNINCVIDHRYLYSGAKGKNLVTKFKQIFENPQKYLNVNQQQLKKNL